MFTLEEAFNNKAKLKVVGVGGAGGNAINRMMEEGIENVEFIAVNTDAQDLERNRAHTRIQVGERVTKGLGAGAKPEVGARAVEEDRNLIMEKIEGADMVFITAGMGGGTGTGGAPSVARIAQEMGILTVAIVTKPFAFEGPRRMRNALWGIEELRKHVDTIIVIPNQKLLSMIDKNVPLMEAFGRVDEILYNATRGISDLITVNGLINIDFADAETIMRGMGDALMGTGIASGENMSQKAAEMAIHSPLLEDISIEGAKGILVNVTGGPDLSMFAIHEAVDLIHDAAGRDNDVNIIFGTVVDPNMQGQIRVTVVATGFNPEGFRKPVTATEAAAIADAVRPPASRIVKAGNEAKLPSSPLPLFEAAPQPPPKVTSAPRAVEQARAQEAANPPKAEKFPEAARPLETVNPPKAGKPLEKEAAALINQAEWGTLDRSGERAPAFDFDDGETIYTEVKKDLAAEKERAGEVQRKVQRFDSLEDIVSPDDLNGGGAPQVRNVGKWIKSAAKKDGLRVENGLLSHEYDNLDYPTFLRQQMD